MRLAVPGVDGRHVAIEAEAIDEVQGTRMNILVGPDLQGH